MDTINLQEIVEKVEFVKRHLNSLLSLENLYQISRIVNTQCLAPRVAKLFEAFTVEGDNFIYSCAEDPNVCQLTMHKPWKALLFAWVRPDGIFLFRIEKEHLYQLGLQINHADGQMIQQNSLFKQSIRFSEEQMHRLSDFLVEIL